MSSGEFADVVLLMTDIEGSTRLWSRYQTRMSVLLAAHDSLLRECVANHSGKVFKGSGDGVNAVFATVDSAAAAAMEIQVRLSSPEWLLGEMGEAAAERIRVRIAIHAGELEPRSGDYFGPPINLASRILSAGHGGQILLSHDAVGRLEASHGLSDRLLDLGAHQLRDVAQPTRIFQLDPSGSTCGRFPPLRTEGDYGDNLPRALTAFFGRAGELASLEQLAESSRLVTITGPGGCGKTRLAIRAAESLKARFPGGVLLIELAGLGSADQILPAIASAAGVKEETDRPLVQTLLDWLREKTRLLVLDNCEHLIDGCASAAETIVTRCPSVTILATSRLRLGVAGERALPLSPLAIPSEDAATPEKLLTFDSVRMLIDRVAAANLTFKFSAGNAPYVARICRRLDGIPLALELAAARAGAMTVEQIAGRMDDRFRLLSRGSRTAMPKQKTLRAAIDWSYDLLEDSERRLLCELSIFVGGWTLAAAEAVCGEATILREPSVFREVWSKDQVELVYGGCNDNGDVLDTLTRLVDRSLVQMVNETGMDEPRYRMLDTIRQYAQEAARRDFGGLLEELKSRYIRYMRAVTYQSNHGLDGPDGPRWCRVLASEQDNIRAAFSLAIDSNIEAALRIGADMSDYARIRGLQTECRSMLDTALVRAKEAQPQAPVMARAIAFLEAGNLAVTSNDSTAAIGYFSESLTLARQAGEQRLVAACVGNLGKTESSLGNHHAAEPMLAEALQLFKELDQPINVAKILAMQADVDQLEARYDLALERLCESLAIRRSIGARIDTATALCRIGSLLVLKHDYVGARPYLMESLAIYSEIQARQGMASALIEMAVVEARIGEPRTAAECLFHVRQLRSQMAEAWAATPSDDARIEAAAAEIGDYLGETELAQAMAVCKARETSDFVAELIANDPVKSLTQSF